MRDMARFSVPAASEVTQLDVAKPGISSEQVDLLYAIRLERKVAEAEANP